MRQLYLIIVLFFAFLCKLKSADNINAEPILLRFHSVNSSNDNIYERIDTSAFIHYWNKFRKTVLNHDTKSLSSMISDSISDGWSWVADSIGHSYNGPKSFLLSNLYYIFTPNFLYLLDSYNIKKDLYSGLDTVFRKIKNYKCIREIENRKYICYTVFNSPRTTINADCNTVTFNMLYFKNDSASNYVTMSDKDLDIDVIYLYEFCFKYTQSGIKLYKINYSINNVSE
jgi:hypothetical protein